MSLIASSLEILNSYHIGKNVLVVDDEPVNCKLIDIFLSEATELNVATLLNGREAIEYLRNFETDIVLMDMQMPDIDGIDTSKEIRKFKSSSELPIIAVTADIFNSNNNRYKEAEINDLLEKPYLKEDLYDIVAKWLSNIEKDA